MPNSRLRARHGRRVGVLRHSSPVAAPARPRARSARRRRLLRGPRNAPRPAAAEAELTAALAEGGAAERAVRLDLADARCGLAALEVETPLIKARLQAVQSAVGRLRRSYGAGEIGVFDLLRGQGTLFEAEIGETRNRIAIECARARVNQALGVVP